MNSVGKYSHSRPAIRPFIKASSNSLSSDVFIGKNNYMKLQKEKYQEDVLNSIPNLCPSPVMKNNFISLSFQYSLNLIFVNSVPESQDIVFIIVLLSIIFNKFNVVSVSLFLQ